MGVFSEHFRTPMFRRAVARDITPLIGAWIVAAIAFVYFVRPERSWGMLGLYTVVAVVATFLASLFGGSVAVRLSRSRRCRAVSEGSQVSSSEEDLHLAKQGGAFTMAAGAGVLASIAFALAVVLAGVVRLTGFPTVRPSGLGLPIDALAAVSVSALVAGCLWVAFWIVPHAGLYEVRKFGAPIPFVGNAAARFVTPILFLTLLSTLSFELNVAPEFVSSQRGPYIFVGTMFLAVVCIPIVILYRIFCFEATVEKVNRGLSTRPYLSEPMTLETRAPSSDRLQPSDGDATGSKPPGSEDARFRPPN